MRRPSFRKFKTVAGSVLGRIAIKTYVCRGCGLWHEKRPTQCKSCGRLDFQKFDSAGEAKRHAALELKVRAGLISDLRTQVNFPLYAAGTSGRVRVGHYRADFVYTRDGAMVIEDFKGAITDLAKWKLRHMAAAGTPVLITTAER